MPTHDDDTLLTAFQRGERWAERELFDRFYKPLTIYAERITGSWAAAEDIATDVIVKGVERRADFAEFGNLKAFFYRLTHNASVNERIRVGRHDALRERLGLEMPLESDAASAIDNQILRAELLREIYAEIEELPARCSQIFKLIFVEGLDNEEIARQLDINVQTVRSQKARAISMIRTALLKKHRMGALLFFYAWLQLHS